MADTKQPPSETAADSWRKRVEGYRERILDKLLLGVPIALSGKLIDWLTGEFTRQPWQAVWFLVPLGIAAWIAYRAATGRKDLQLSRSYLVFLSIYILFFFTASAASFLDWSRTLTIFETKAPRNWLAPPAAGDWRYKMVRKKDPSPLVIVTLEPAEGRKLEDARYDLVQLVTIASRSGALGIAFDFFLKDRSDLDPLLCDSIQKAGIPVLAGYGFLRVGDNVVPTSTAETLRPCLPEERQGHLAGFLDIDHVARFVPLFFGNERLPALSLRAARTFAGESNQKIETPAGRLLRFVEPSRQHPQAAYEELLRNPDMRGILKGRFLLVGEKSEKETFETPFGPRLGVAIHATAVHSLLQNWHIHATPWWLSILFIAVVCYWITARAAQGAPTRSLVLLCAIVTLGLAAAAALMIVIGPWWLDVVYPIAAVWLLLPLLLGLRRIAASRAQAGPAAA